MLSQHVLVTCWNTYLADITFYWRLFLRCLEDDVIQVKVAFDELQHRSMPVPVQPLATLAAANGRAGVLRICLKPNAVFDSNLDNAASQGLEDLAMLELLWTVDWRDMQRSKSFLKSLIPRSLGQDAAILTWLVDHGVPVTRDTVVPAAFVRTREFYDENSDQNMWH